MPQGARQVESEGRRMILTVHVRRIPNDPNGYLEIIEDLPPIGPATNSLLRHIIELCKMLPPAELQFLKMNGIRFVQQLRYLPFGETVTFEPPPKE